MNEKIGLKDIIGLAMKGYKPGDIKELLELAESANQKEDLDKATTPDDQAGKDEPEGGQENGVDEKKSEPSETEKELRKQIDELNSKIKTLQDENTKKEVDGKVKTDEEKFVELVKDFF